MISNQTVFVVGAGASMPYGFPSGESLLNYARNSALPRLAESVTNRFSTSQVREFHDLVLNAQIESLDALLEFRTEFQDIGKHFIAAQILSGEASALFSFGETDPWLSYVISRMLDGCSSPAEMAANNHVTFVTYNYDRLIEDRIDCALDTQFGLDVAGRQDILRAFPVIHLHGSLGPYYGPPDVKVPFGVLVHDLDTRELRPFAGEMALYIHRAAGQIQIVHQANPDSDEFRAARDVLRNARKERIWIFVCEAYHDCKESICRERSTSWQRVMQLLK